MFSILIVLVLLIAFVVGLRVSKYCADDSHSDTKACKIVKKLD